MQRLQSELNLRIILLVIFTALAAVAHKGKIHVKEKAAETKEEKTTLEKINEQYVADVKSIFQKSCFDCHSSKTNFPWYSKLPGAKQLIERDVVEAKQHLNLDSDYPFESHATPIEDLQAIRDTINKDEMPPFRYRIMHSGSNLSVTEKKKVNNWIEQSLNLLKDK